jgi:hypothetical protein
LAAVLERTDHQLCMPELMAAKLAATAPNGGSCSCQFDPWGGGPAVILISAYAAADFARPIAESPATGFLPKQKLSADAIGRIVDGREPAGPPGVPAR